MARPRGAAAGAAPHTVWDYTRKVQDPLERGAFLLKSGFEIGDLGNLARMQGFHTFGPPPI